ncbi:MAG TPA: DUF6088 family protein [Candidatus Gastranaerophilales bacterium]|nr:DUF6088 family protein [Candidatus Gastranaerophilales bacterium]
MPVKQTLEKRIQYRIKRSKDAVFMLSDFEDLSDKDQIGRALRKLEAKNIIIKVGQGVYARAKISKATQKPIPEKDIRSIAVDVLKKCGVKIIESEFEKNYNSGISTQVPTGRVIGINKRVSRKIGFNGNYIKYAKVSG